MINRYILTVIIILIVAFCYADSGNGQQNLTTDYAVDPMPYSIELELGPDRIARVNKEITIKCQIKNNGKKILQ